MSYRPTISTNFKSVPNLINFLWIKIEEKYKKSSKAFRFFDAKKRSKISLKDFEIGIENLRIKLHKSDIKLIFKYLDADKDRFLNYREFLTMNQNSSLPNKFANEPSTLDSARKMSQISSRVKSINSRMKNVSPSHRNGKEDKLSASSFYYKGYRYGASRLGRQSSRLSNYSWIGSEKHGIPNEQSEDITNVMNHSFVYDNLKNGIRVRVRKPLCKAPTKASKLQRILRKVQKRCCVSKNIFAYIKNIILSIILYPKFKTLIIRFSFLSTPKFCSIGQNRADSIFTIRDDYLKSCKEKLNNSSTDQPKVEWKIRKFLGIGPHEDIANSIRRLKKFAPNRVMNTSTNLPDVSKNEDLPLEAQPVVNKKEKDKLLSEYYSKKREMSSQRSNF